MKIKIKELKEKLDLVSRIDTSINDKLTYGIKKIQNQIQSKVKPIVDEFNSKLEDIKIDYCDKDDKDQIILDDKGNMSFKSAENLKNLNSKVRDINSTYEESEIDFKPYIVTDCERLKDIDLFLKEELTGILL
jgi:hypothetical protein